MKLHILSFLLLFSVFISFSQEAKEINPVYRAEYEKINDLVHTKLDVKFDFAKQHLLGEAWLTLEPHFYPSNELTLDAKAMLIHKVTRNGKDLKYMYDGEKLNIKLGNMFAKGEQFDVYIKYTARPEEVTQEGSAAIKNAKGLYFIDPDDSDPNKPTQIWTQGETESNSCWFPTIDSPNQKTTEEIYITVPNKFVTLSNGLLLKQTENSDGTRTDYWKLDQKHAPYLFFMGIGEYSIVKDTWKNIAVDYYVEKEYEPYAKEIFGLTPEMIQFYSDYTGVEYMWPKYAQIVGRDYVSGAMENTTAVLHQERAYQTSGQLIDENIWENTIAHEIFHHWFGDLVTAESWSNITVNESFANYSEYLWIEHKYGADAADAHLHEEIQGYLAGSNEIKDLVRFYYNSREDMFDRVSYNKGGAILHMLRKHIGDAAFRDGIKAYLTDNSYGTGEAHQLRLAMEKVTGKDLNPFFNQWYFNNGHPELDVTYTYSTAANMVTVNIKQTQPNMFVFPLAIDVYEGPKTKRYEVLVDEKEKSFSFKYGKKPNLVNVDAEHFLLAEINDDKTIENYVFQYENAPKYEDRRSAIEKLINNQTNEVVYKTLTKALNDSYFKLRIKAIKGIDISKTNSGEAIKIIEKLATSDEKTLVQEAAIVKLGLLEDAKYKDLFNNSLKSKSNAVKRGALNALVKIDKEAAISFANSINDKIEKESLKDDLIPLYIIDKNESELPFVANDLIAGIFYTNVGETNDRTKLNIYKEGFQWVAASDSEEATQNLVDKIVSMGVNEKQYGADKLAIQLLNQILSAKEVYNYANMEQLNKIVLDGLEALK